MLHDRRFRHRSIQIYRRLNFISIITIHIFDIIIIIMYYLILGAW